MTAFFDNIRVAMSGLLANKLRSGLTMLGISFGVAAVIVLVSLGQAVQDYVANQFLGIGTNIALVIPSSLSGQGGGSGVSASNRLSPRFSSITESDWTALSDPFNVPDAKAAIPLLSITQTVLANNNQVRVRIHSTSPDYFSARNRTLAFGRFFDANDMTDSARVAVLGIHTVDALFPDNPVPLDENIRVNGIAFKIIGVMGKYGGSSFGTDEDNLVVIPISTGLARLESNLTLSGSKPLTFIYLQSTSEKTMNAAVQEATETLRKAHNITFRDADDFQILTQQDLIKSFAQITNLLTIFLGIIAGISLLVGGIGIMNIMLVTVTERTREIGLRKAVGARAGDVLLQFLTEATVLALAGEFFGLLVALLGTLVLRVVLPALNATVRFESVVLATSISAAIGIFFGLYPASRASRLNPIDALRYE